MLQGDSLYDLVERSDLAVVKSNLDLQSDASTGNSMRKILFRTALLNMGH